MVKRAKEHDAVLATLKHYTDGTFEGDVAKLKLAFHEKATLSGYIHTPQTPPEGALLLMPIEGLYNHMSGTPSPKAEGAPYAARVGEIVVRGAMARAVVYEDGLAGLDFVNELILHKVGDRWLITNKAFSADPQ